MRRLLDAHDANTYQSDGRWRIDDIPGIRGRKKGVFALITDDGGLKVPSSNTSKNNDLFFAFFRRPCAIRSAEIVEFSAVENKGVMADGISAEPFCDAVCQNALLPTAAQIPLKNNGGNMSDDNASKINGEKGSYFRRADDRRTAEISDFSAQQNQVVADGAFKPPSNPSTREEDDIDFMMGDPLYARPAQKRPA